MSNDENHKPPLPPVANKLEVVDPHSVPTIIVDAIATGGLHNGIVNLTLGTLDYTLPSANGLAKIVVATRLRISEPFARHLHAVLGGVLGIPPPAAPHPPGSDTPPRNLMN